MICFNWDMFGKYVENDSNFEILYEGLWGQSRMICKVEQEIYWIP